MSNEATRHVATTQRPYKQKYSIIIPAAGAGTRMKSYGPICLLKMGSTTILERQLNIIASTFNDYEIIVVGGFEAQKIQKTLPESIHFIENRHFEHTSVIHSISLGLTKATTNNVLIVYGDLVFNPATLVMPIYNTSALLISNEMKKDEVGCVVQDNIVQNMMYDLTPKWSQIAFITGKELKSFKHLVTTESCSRLLGFEVINKIINQGGIFHTVTSKDSHIIDVDTSKDIARAEIICTQ